MDVWEFVQYEANDGDLPVMQWYASLTPKNQAKADKFLRIAKREKQLRMPHFGPFQELMEARWYGENRVQHRIFCYVPSGRCVTFLCGCTHKGKRYKPASAYNTAIRRRNEIREGRATTHEFDF